MATFSERFKELRKEKGMSQRELATALHMSNSAVAMYETGKRQPDLEAYMHVTVERKKKDANLLDNVRIM